MDMRIKEHNIFFFFANVPIISILDYVDLLNSFKFMKVCFAPNS